MRNEFSLKSCVEEFIQSAFESGLFIKWDRESQRKKKLIDPYEPEPVILLYDLLGIYISLLAVGYSISILTFFCEILIHKKMMQPRRRKIWRYLE